MEIFHTEYLISSPDITHCPKGNLPEIAFIGRSNVGKSSLINMLTNKKELAKVSSSPGKTQMINHFLINKNMYWVDLPGYGFAKVSQSKRVAWAKMIWTYVEERENLQTLFVLIDSRHTPQKMDIEFVNKLGSKAIPFTIVFTKADKESQKEVSEHVTQFKKALLATWSELPPIFVTSAVKRLARKEMLAYIEKLRLAYVPAEVIKQSIEEEKLEGGSTSA
ncbi:MAG: YihA family ribosome biogenesis GTP-binding protein [Bacteroidetes bacterium]|nr:YihA family ribosome biogenesis GTP-binding protein [Bacteroidota bacterium]